jgi:hypothetical protein
MAAQRDSPKSDEQTTNGRSVLGAGLERALARLTIVDDHLRKVDEHVARARAAERAATAR